MYVTMGSRPKKHRIISMTEQYPVWKTSYLRGIFMMHENNRKLKDESINFQG